MTFNTPTNPVQKTTTELLTLKVYSAAKRRPKSALEDTVVYVKLIRALSGTDLPCPCLQTFHRFWSNIFLLPDESKVTHVLAILLAKMS